MKRALLILVALILAAGAQGSKSKFAPAEGRWWLAASAEQRNGFFIGYDDCAAYMLRQPAPFIANVQVEDAITTYYRTHQEDVRLPVTAVIARLYAQWQRLGTYRFTRAKPGDGYIGDTWLGGEVAAGLRLGIINGFLACQTTQGMAMPVTSPSEIEKRVSAWYGTGTDETPAEKHYNEALSEVILRAEREGH